MKTVILKKNEHRRIRAGHAWVFSNEVDTQKCPLRNYSPGDRVEFQNSIGDFLAIGYVNPKSLIFGRVLSRRQTEIIDHDFFRCRIIQALNIRDRLFPDDPYYRMIYGESDGLPGLVVDRYGTTLVAQITTAGMEILKNVIQDILLALLCPHGILWKNDGAVREQEGLHRLTDHYGEVPSIGEVWENRLHFHFPFQEGQKTGWFFDQRLNRARFATYCHNRTVLDVFSYVGAGGINAACQGAQAVLCVDISTQALEHVLINAKINHVSDRVNVLAGDAFQVLKDFEREGRFFDCIILDPPALIKRQKDLAAGTEAYLRLNILALRLLPPGGVLMSCSCSHHLSSENLLNILRIAGLKTERKLRVLEFGHQGPDHPVHPAMPETQYLKTFIVMAF